MLTVENENVAVIFLSGFQMELIPFVLHCEHIYRFTKGEIILINRIRI